MNDLVAFINARYDEREKVANAADGARWEAQGGAVWDERNGSVVAGFTRVYPECAIEMDEGDTRHIALNDPAAALADIAMKRRILELWEDPAEVRHPTDRHDSRDWSEVDEQVAAAEAIDHVVRLLASEFDTHPDYQKGWAP